MAIDTRIQFPTLGQQIEQASAAASGLGANVVAGYQAATRKRELDLQRADQQQAQQAAMQRFAQSAQAIGSIATQIRNTQDWGEKFQILGSNPALWTNAETRPAMQAMTELLRQQKEVSSITGTMADLARMSDMRKSTQNEIIDTFSKFQPNDRIFALDMFQGSGYKMTPELYNFIGEAQERSVAATSTGSLPAPVITEQEYNKLLTSAQDARTSGDVALAASLEQRAENLKDFAKAGKDFSSIDLLKFRAQLDALNDILINRDPAKLEARMMQIEELTNELKNQSNEPTAPEPSAGVANPKTQSDYDALPYGTVYVGPDGIQRIKK